MKIKWLHIILFLFVAFGEMTAQSKSRFNSLQPSPIEQKLAEARKLKSTNPTKAIEILEGVFGQAKRKKDPTVESEAYFLLGEIYEEIGQKELALQRYENAYRLIKNSGNKIILTTRLLALGQISYDLKSYEKAQTYFQKCVEYKMGDATEIRCQEGLADVAIAQKDFERGLGFNVQIEQTPQYQSDSLLQSKVMARNAEIYANQNQQSRANDAYLNSIQNLPQQQQISEEDYQTFKKAKSTVNSYNASPKEQIDLNISTLEKAPLQSIPVNSVLEERLAIADLYLNIDDLVSAEKYLAEAKEVVDEAVSAEKKAEVFKKSSELNFKKGAYEMAQADYQKYTLEKDKIIEAKEQELNQLIAILQGQSKIDLIEKDVAYEEKEADYLEDQLFTQRIIIGLLSLLLLAALAAFYFILKNVKARRQANQLLLLKSLRTQMNPHFIFNALNSVNNFISKNDERSANKFLTDFSKLMRLVLNHSQKDFIALEEELNLIELYLKLEHLRFRDKFDFDFKKETTLSAVDLQIPPMLIQPFIENAIWHGLRYKTEKGQLNVSVQKEGKTILVTIKDNGIGRQKSQTLKTINQKNYQSEGLKNVGKRLELINQIYGKNYQISIADANPTETEPGTIVHLKIPTDT
jgi:tetratricopeptide (TPR) repeat protein